MAIAFVVPLVALLAAVVSPAPNRQASLPSPPIPLPDHAGWARAVDHPYFPLVPGKVLVYASGKGAHAEIDSVEVLRATRAIVGAAATVVHDRTLRGGVTVEDTYDWYAQDAAGNVWYLGEDTHEYRHGKPVSSAGSWEAGRGGAQPGIVMWAKPVPGAAYRQEFRRGSAEDMASVLDVHAKLSADGVTYDDCILTEEWSPLEPGVREHKYYARGIGLVREVAVKGPPESMTLRSVGSR